MGRHDASTGHHRVTFTKYPDPAAPQLFCPTCGLTLADVDTVFSGVDEPERNDRYTCTLHGPFEFCQRTRKLRAVATL